MAAGCKDKGVSRDGEWAGQFRSTLSLEGESMKSPHNPVGRENESGAVQSATQGATASAVTAFAPLPLRARGVLETFDVALRVFRRYFKVLLSWAAFVAIISGVSGGIVSGASNPASLFNTTALLGLLAATVSLTGLLSLLLWPLVIGAVACCLAAAVRGQAVTFGQCWQFTRPRYWSILGSCILAGLLAFVLGIVGILAFSFIIAIVVGAISALPTTAIWITGIMSFLAFLIGPVCLMSLLGTWFTMVPIVVCMEDDKRNSSSLGRASDLMKGHWRRALSLGFVLGLATLLFWAVIQVTVYLLRQLPTLMGMAQGTTGEQAGWGIILISSLLSALMSAISTPFAFLVVALFYLDLRVRKEALDLEWAAHATAPAASAHAVYANAVYANAAPAPTSFSSPEFAATGFQSLSPSPTAATSGSGPTFVSPQNVSPQDVLPPTESGPFSAALFDNRNDVTPISLKPDVAPIASPHATARLPQETSGAPFAPPAAGGFAAQTPLAPLETAPRGTEVGLDSPPQVAAPSTDAFAAPMSTHGAASGARLCAGCGAECAATLTFCMQCGARLPASEAAR